MPATRNDHIGVPLGRLDELEVHRLYGGQVLVEDLVQGAAPLGGVSPNAPDEADVGIGIDEHLHVTELAHTRVPEQQDAIHDYDVRRRDDDLLIAARVVDEIVDWFFDRLARGKSLQLIDEKRPVERVGVIPVDLLAFGIGQVSKVEIVGVHVDERDGLRVQCLRDISRHGRFSRTGPAGDADDEWLHAKNLVSRRERTLAFKMRFRSFFAAGAIVGAAACQSVSLFPAAQPVDLVVAATTDVHGRIRGWDYYADAPDSMRGLARAATIIDSLRRASPVLPIVVDAGDFLQGNPLAYVAARVDTTMPNPIIAAMNVVQYDAVVIGNHEFNYGLPGLERAMRQADFPMLAANARRPDGTQRFASWAVSMRHGIKVAIVGATTPGSMVWDRDNLAGQVVVRDIVPDVRTAVRDARNAAAAVIIVVVHSGLDEPSSYDTVGSAVASENVAARLAHEVPGIDLIVYGHSHKQMADTVIGTTLLMQPKNWATSVAVAHLGLVPRDGHWRVISRRSSLVPAVHHHESAQVVAVSQEGHRATIRYATTPIGSTPVAWRADSARVVDTPLMDFILEVERRASGAQLASTAAFSLDASLAAGPITVARMAALYPYDNTLRAIRISGRQLREYLEQSARYFQRRPDGSAGIDRSIPGYNYDMVAGVDYTIDLSNPIGQRIVSLTYDGRPVAPTDTFTMALNSYRQTGGGGFAMLRNAPVVYDRQMEIRDLLIDEVRRKGTLLPSDYFHPNWRLLPTSAIGQLMTSLR